MAAILSKSNFAELVDLYIDSENLCLTQNLSYLSQKKQVILFF